MFIVRHHPILHTHTYVHVFSSSSSSALLPRIFHGQHEHGSKTGETIDVNGATPKVAGVGETLKFEEDGVGRVGGRPGGRLSILPSSVH